MCTAFKIELALQHFNTMSFEEAVLLDGGEADGYDEADKAIVSKSWMNIFLKALAALLARTNSQPITYVFLAVFL